MKLKEARIKAGIMQTDIVPLLKKVEPRADASLISRYENNICLPTPEQFKVFCAAYDKEPADLCTPEEVNFGVKGRKKDTHRPSYRLCVRIPLEFMPERSEFKKMLAACGYASVVSWICHCLKRLQAEYAARTGKSRPDVSASKAAKQINLPKLYQQEGSLSNDYK